MSRKKVVSLELVSVASQRLERCWVRPVDVTLIDRANHHFSQPLLYQVATAALSPGEFAFASRSLFSRTANFSVLLEEVKGVDVGMQEVITAVAQFSR
jgi:NADH dehydrogenase FAD-containing subunit